MGSIFYLTTINLVAFLMCYIDKKRAKAGAARISEAELYIIALLGGSIGLLIGMKVFRHKTRKSKFQFFLAIVIILQLIILTTASMR